MLTECTTDDANVVSKRVVNGRRRGKNLPRRGTLVHHSTLPTVYELLNGTCMYDVRGLFQQKLARATQRRRDTPVRIATGTSAQRDR